MFTLDLALDGLKLPFGLKDYKIRSLRDFNQELLARVKEDFRDSYLSLSTALDRLIHPAKNSGDFLELDSSSADQSKKGGKGGKKDGLLTSLEDFEIPRVLVTKFTSATNSRAGLSEE
jgi:hypothetical protein